MNVVRTAKALIYTLEEFIDQAEAICDDFKDSLPVHGLLEAVDRYLNELLEGNRLDGLSREVDAAVAGDETAKAQLEQRCQDGLCPDLLRLASEEQRGAVGYLKERFGIDLTHLAYLQ